MVEFNRGATTQTLRSNNVFNRGATTQTLRNNSMINIGMFNRGATTQTLRNNSMINRGAIPLTLWNNRGATTQTLLPCELDGVCCSRGTGSYVHGCKALSPLTHVCL